ncbi:MAG: efflux transporter outer membrane subunit [Pseudomonadota bacterium]
MAVLTGRQTLQRAGTALGLALLTACAGVEPMPAEEAQIPQPETLAHSELVAPDWPQLFTQPALDALIEEALANNQDWRATRARLRAAVAATGDDQRWPTLSAEIDRQRRDDDGNRSDSASAALRMNWELDIWGRLAAQNASEDFTAGALAADAAWARYSLAANVAKAWFQASAQRAQWALNRERHESLGNSLETIEDGYRRGTRQALEVYSARAELANSESQLTRSERLYQQSRYQLNLLLGRYPGAEVSVPESLPEPGEPLPAQLSSELLERRPDVRAAQLELAAKAADLKVARRNRLPRFSLTASAGNASDRLSEVASGNDPFWSALGNLTLPLFQGGALAAEQSRQAELYQAKLAEFRGTALQAFSETLNALDSESALWRQWLAARRAATTAEQAADQSFERYIAGLENFNTWLQAQRTAYDRASAAIDLQAQLLQNRVDLHLALGGRFDKESTRSAPDAS